MDGRDGKTVGHFSSVTSAVVSMCSAVSLASPRMSDRAMVKHPACAAPMSSSGLVPGLPSKRLLKPYGYSLSAPLLVEMAPLPSLMPPCQTADPWVFISSSPFVAKSQDVRHEDDPSPNHGTT